MAETSAGVVRVALLGYGVVGREVARLLSTSSADLTARAGRRLSLVGIGVRDVDKAREHARTAGGVLPAELFRDDLSGLVAEGQVDVVVELIGGIEPARTLLLQAMEGGASVVTANKALLAEDGATLYEAAEKHGVDLYYEAAVAGAIPLLRPLRESLVGDTVRRVLGIVNGTTNYILSRMDETGASFDDALAEAQALGYAEADPTADVDGYDAAAKAAILAGLAYHSRVTLADVSREGIRGITATDMADAHARNCTIKLLAIAEAGGSGEESAGVTVRVHPAMVPRTHPLASVREAYNAVFVEAASAGELMFYGRGAGGTPTASAVLGDLVAVARNRLTGARGPAQSVYADLPVRPVGEAHTRYHVHLEVPDRPGVLAAIAQEFAGHNVSLATVRQEGAREGQGLEERSASLVVVTHTAREADLAATVDSLRLLDAVQRVVSVLRVEGEPA